jgi:hypothetical protein
VLLESLISQNPSRFAKPFCAHLRKTHFQAVVKLWGIIASRSAAMQARNHSPIDPIDPPAAAEPIALVISDREAAAPGVAHA